MGAITAAFALIESCLQNREFADAHLYASTLWEIINHKYDNKIPDDRREAYIARGAYYLAQATLRLAMNGGIPPREKQKAGEKVSALARRALEIHTQLYGVESENAINDMCVLADTLVFFNDDYDEFIRLYKQAVSIYIRLQGSTSPNVAICKSKLSDVYNKKAGDANDKESCIENLEKTLCHSREAVRIFRAVGRMEEADKHEQRILEVEEALQRFAATTTKG